MSKWQPIETVPKDVPVLLYQEPRELFEDYWIPGEPRMIVGIMGRFPHPSSTCNIGGYESDCDVDEPTHWMPLPDPPVPHPVPHKDMDHGGGARTTADDGK